MQRTSFDEYVEIARPSVMPRLCKQAQMVELVSERSVKGTLGKLWVKVTLAALPNPTILTDQQHPQSESVSLSTTLLSS